MLQQKLLLSSRPVEQLQFASEMFIKSRVLLSEFMFMVYEGGAQRAEMMHVRCSDEIGMKKESCDRRTAIPTYPQSPTLPI